MGYIIVDAVGVTKSQKTTSRQLERKPTVSLKELMMSVATGAHDDDTLTTLAGRLEKLDKVMSDNEKADFFKVCGKPCIAIASDLLDAFDEDKNPTKKEQKNAALKASKPFNDPIIRDFIENVRKSHDQIIDTVNVDEVTFGGWNSEREKKANEVIETFSKFIEENKTNIEALEIIYNQSYRSRPVTFDMIDELYKKLQASPYHLTTDKLWSAYTICFPNKVKAKSIVNKLADIISLVRFQLGQTDNLRLFSDEVNLRFRDWTLAKNAGHIHFTGEQLEWLRMIRDHIAASINITKEDLDLSPFGDRGGLGKFYQLFGNQYETILEEMNSALLEAA